MAHSRVLLVEGKDDQHVLWALLGSHGVPQQFSVEMPREGERGAMEEPGGIEKLLDSIPVRLKATGLERLGIVIDADDDLPSRWQQVRDRLRGAQIAGVPDSPDPDGTIIRDGTGLTIGVWLMPDNRTAGILEHFLAFLIPLGNREIEHVDRFLDGIPDGERLFPEQRLAKARLHAWLSIQREPGKPLGQSITARYLDADAKVVRPFIDWLRAVLID